MKLTDELKQRLFERIKFYIDFANQKFNSNIPMPTIEFTQRGVIAATAYDGDHKININPELYVRNVEEFLAQIVPHEVAHLVVYILYPTKYVKVGRRWVRTVKPHGKEWKHIMTTFGVEPQRCHDFDVSEVKRKNTRKYQYKCNCKIHYVGIGVHRKISKGVCYYCKSCKGMLRKF